MFKPVSAKVNFPKLEEKILEFWKKNKIFEKSVEQRPKTNLYSFYDGPPFVTGFPHYGGLLPSIAKDVIPRYQTMKGKRVKRVWGWDCHGLPIENRVEKKLGLKNRRDILKFGINEFITECRQYVEETASEWKWYIDHIGRWVEFDNAYRTMDLEYMETVIWVFKQLYDKGLIYKGNRVSLFCPRCSTPVSNFEIAMDDSYAMMKDPAVTVKFKLKGRKFKDTYILAWTTTPWTLPSNRALVVDKKEQYVKVRVAGHDGFLILGKKRLRDSLAGEKFKTIEEFKGERLLKIAYEPLYTFFPGNRKDFKVYHFEGMVNMDEGTGIVHSAPGFGEIDTEMGNHFGLTLMFSVDDEGKFVDKVGEWAGFFVKDADQEIIKDLRNRNLLFKEEIITHRYPYCYRCETPLLYKAQDSWFINVQKLKKQLLKTNQKINWVPGHFKHGRFKKGIETAPDWCISRTRYWATIMPIWECQQCHELKVVGSIKEIEKLGGEKVTDLHRVGVDHIAFQCEKCKGIMKRIPEVLDCWMESGSMPYAQLHHPFENKKEFKQSFPADYIIEYTGQVRAWFYVMHVVSNALMNSHCFKNVVVTGVISGTDGRKMSKSYGNYPDPRSTLEKYGGDAMRLYFMGSPVMLGRDMNITKGEEIADQVKTVLLPFWNSYRYFITFANLSRWQPNGRPDNSRHVLDRWIMARLSQFHRQFTHFMEVHHLPQATRLIREFIEDLSRWYIRRSRERFVEGDKTALATLYDVLARLTLVTAPIIPFLTEEIYLSLKVQGFTRPRPSRDEVGKGSKAQSVHLQNWPEAGRVNRKLLREMELVRKICELGHAAREKAGIKVRQPLKSARCKVQSAKLNNELLQLIKDELNLKEIVWQETKVKEPQVKLDTKITSALKAEGEARELVRQIQELRKKMGCKLDQKIEVYAPRFPKEKTLKQFISRKTLAKKLIPGKTLTIKKV